MEKFQEVFDKWAKVNKELYQESKNYLQGILEKLPDNSIEIIEDAPCCCSYNGGNHPEYASNCFNQVYDVFLKDNKIYLNTEEDSCYSIEDVTADELYDIANSVECSLID